MNLVGPASPSQQTANAGPGASLRAGVSISVTVLEDLGSGLWRVEAGGRQLTARSEGSLVLGSSFLAKVEAGPDGEALLLRVLDSRPLPPSSGPQGFDRLLQASGLAADPAGRWAASALLAQGQKALPAVLARVRRASLSDADAPDPRTLEARSAIAAGLEAKGLAASPEAVDGLLDLAGDGQGAGQGRGQGSQGGGQGSQAGGQAGPGPGISEPQPPSPEVELLLSAEDAEKGLSAFLRGLCLASGKESLLGLYNHARAGGRGSILVPFAFSLDSIAFSGSFRIQLPYMDGGPGRIEARFTVQGPDEAGGRPWAFDLGFGGQRPQLSLLEAGGTLPGADLAEALGSSLMDLGCGVGLAASGRRELDVEA
jgi:hypothetical protein